MRNNQPAFPVSEEKFSCEHADFNGLSKREYFAAKALQGLLAKEDGGSYLAIAKEDGILPQTLIARMALSLADALIDELKPTPESAKL